MRDSGRARTILPHPTNPDVLYFLTSGGGLWRTKNWTTGGGGVAFGRNPNTLYLGLGDFFDQILVGGSMTRSRNGGVTWDSIIELGTAVSVRDVKVDTSTNRDIVLVATENGLYRSADEGDTYSAISANRPRRSSSPATAARHGADLEPRIEEIGLSGTSVI